MFTLEDDPPINTNVPVQDPSPQKMLLWRYPSCKRLTVATKYMFPVLGPQTTTRIYGCSVQHNTSFGCPCKARSPYKYVFWGWWEILRRSKILIPRYNVLTYPFSPLFRKCLLNGDAMYCMIRLVLIIGLIRKIQKILIHVNLNATGVPYP